MKNEIIRKKKVMLDALEELFGIIERNKEDICQEYRKTGELQQKTRYNKETKDWEPAFDDDGNPVMEDVWDYFNIPEKELSDEKKLKLEVWKEVEKTLERLL